MNVNNVQREDQKPMKKQCDGDRYSTVQDDKWAIQAPNTPQLSPEKQQIPQRGAVKGAASGEDSSFAVAVTSIMQLPLSDSEKAEAVRRLLNASKG